MRVWPSKDMMKDGGGCHGDEGGACWVWSGSTGDSTGGWRWDGRTVLPVAVGHGILSLLLLEELCDGQELFQHVLLSPSLIAQSAQLV